MLGWSTGAEGMNPEQRNRVIRRAERALGRDYVRRILGMSFADAGFGYDAFGQERETGIAALLATRWLYNKYFRVESRGHEHVPKTGPVILAGNHSGLLPFDGMMVGIDLMERMVPPRAMRAIADNWLATVPFFGTFIARAGQVIGHRRNFEKLLGQGQLVMVFPEGAKGIAKPFSERYRLKRFNVGFVELALLHRAPIVPVAVVGAEEQAPVLVNSRRVAATLGLPFFPITPTWPLLGPLGLLPLPVKYHVRYGEPLRFDRDYGPEHASDSLLVQHLALEVQSIVQRMVDDGRAERKGVFR